MADGGGRAAAVGDCDSAAVIDVAVTVIMIMIAVIDDSFIVASFVSTESLTGRKTLVTNGTLVHLSGDG